MVSFGELKFLWQNAERVSHKNTFYSVFVWYLYGRGWMGSVGFSLCPFRIYLVNCYCSYSFHSMPCSISTAMLIAHHKSKRPQFDLIALSNLHFQKSLWKQLFIFQTPRRLLWSSKSKHRAFGYCLLVANTHFASKGKKTLFGPNNPI